MKNSPIYQKVKRHLHWILGGSILVPVLSGCDPDIQTVVLGGVQDFAVTLVDAFFLTLASDDGSTVTTMLADMTSMLG